MVFRSILIIVFLINSWAISWRWSISEWRTFARLLRALVRLRWYVWRCAVRSTFYSAEEFKASALYFFNSSFKIACVPGVQQLWKLSYYWHQVWNLVTFAMKSTEKKSITILYSFVLFLEMNLQEKRIIYFI